jgi:hypothetical protein
MERKQVRANASPLALVSPPRAEGAPGRADGSELALVSALFTLSLVPVLGELLRPGRWTAGLTGLATAAALLTGRELWSQLRARARGD